MKLTILLANSMHKNELENSEVSKRRLFSSSIKPFFSQPVSFFCIMNVSAMKIVPNTQAHQQLEWSKLTSYIPNFFREKIQRHSNFTNCFYLCLGHLVHFHVFKRWIKRHFVIILSKYNSKSTILDMMRLQNYVWVAKGTFLSRSSSNRLHSIFRSRRHFQLTWDLTSR